jgi:3-deoxy-D-manno-octulosonic-acid transferase
VTNRYGPAAPEKTGRVPDRLHSAVTQVITPGSMGNHPEPEDLSPCLWLHAVSVGEVKAAQDLAKRFLDANPRWELRVSTTTATGRDLAIRLFGRESVIYYPLDFTGMVDRAFRRIRPTLIVLMELEVWPNFLQAAAARQIPVVVANARITERSFRRLSRLPWLARNLMRGVDEWYPQTATYAKRLERLGAPVERVTVLGSVKYDAVPSVIDLDKSQEYRRLFGCCHQGKERRLLVAGSTHPGEEKTLLSAWSELPDRPLLFLAPRHPERLSGVTALAQRHGKTVRRSDLPSQPGAGEDFDLIIGDRMGELADIYGAADLVFVGGTLVRHGGQNFLEPCGLARPTIVGPHLWNFAEPAELLAAGQALRVVRDQPELTQALREILADPVQALAMGERAREIILRERGAGSRIVERLNKLAKTVQPERENLKTIKGRSVKARETAGSYREPEAGSGGKAHG